MYIINILKPMLKLSDFIHTCHHKKFIKLIIFNDGLITIKRTTLHIFIPKCSTELKEFLVKECDYIESHLTKNIYILASDMTKTIKIYRWSIF
jgi:hypothetical protein